MMILKSLVSQIIYAVSSHHRWLTHTLTYTHPGSCY